MFSLHSMQQGKKVFTYQNYCNTQMNVEMNAILKIFQATAEKKKKILDCW
jgi:hypothetical protein